jgi:fructose-1,6-bisphosphatase-3
VINLQSIINLPKGTEHFITDIHGEFEAFAHVLKNGSGSVKKKIDEVFGHTLSKEDKRALATLIYYPNRKMDRLKKQYGDLSDWYKITLYRLIEVCKLKFINKCCIYNRILSKKILLIKKSCIKRTILLYC